VAQKPIRETQAKALIRDQWPQEYAAGKPAIRFAEIDGSTDLLALPHNHPWLTEGKVVAKVDELFGKRGKLGYVQVAETWEETKIWMEGLRKTTATVAGRCGVLEHFIVEPFVEHEEELYLAFTCERTEDVILFSRKGGMDVEEQGASIVRIPVPLGTEPELSQLQGLDTKLTATIRGLFSLFRSLDLPSVEFNPIAVNARGVYLLDCVARVDTCAAFRQRSTWGLLSIPEGFGSTRTPEELFISDLDAKSGSSLKFVLLHPQGRIWTMVAGGGASIIYADAITAQVDPKELANYGEWSGNPSTDEMEAYTGKILSLIEKNDREQALIIGGGIANFTDVARTFAGVIAALEDHAPKLKNLKIFVRRAGPNDRRGLKALQEACNRLRISCVTHGAELPMTAVVSEALSALHLTPDS